jgi:hypothetical protein
MVELRLSDAKAALLAEILESDLGELRAEIARTDSMEYREKLKERAELVRETIRELRARPAPIHI